MLGKNASQLAEWLGQGRNRIGEVWIGKEDGSHVLRHVLDEESNGLEVGGDPEKALEWSKYDAQGKYRPLRTAPTLRRGWMLRLATLDEVVRALDYFYPAMLGIARAFAAGEGRPVNLRDTLNRQTGMYRVAGKITREQADGLIGEACALGQCTKVIPWRIEADFPIGSLPQEKTDLADAWQREGGTTIPMPCEECCNILVAAARETVKKSG